jgi:hypothetical protein
MWPTPDIWQNAFLLAAIGGAAILCAAIGSVMGRSPLGVRMLRASPLVVIALAIAYVVTMSALSPATEIADCVYAPAHPSNC